MAFRGCYGQPGRVLADRISQNIRRVREAHGLSRLQLAQRCNPVTSSQQIERLEKGERRLTVEWIERLANALDVDPSELMAVNGEQFAMTPEVADEVAAVLGRIALQGATPAPAVLQVLSVFVQELSETFGRHPEARHDPQAARLVTDLLTHRPAR
jgi:transcriptional regulator with XRE-family HTH domain